MKSARRSARPGETEWCSAARLEADWKVLCRDIGERRAGTAGEKSAADYIVAELQRAGVKEAQLEPFPCLSLREGRAEVLERRGSKWVAVEATPVVGAPATPGWVQGELAWLELPEQTNRLKRGSLRGKILALFGPMPTELEGHRRLLAADPLAIIHVDERLPFTWTKNDGVYPYWAREHGMLPTLTVPYLEAWRWKRQGVSRLRVRVRVRQEETTSYNVIGELPGTDPRLPALAVSAHHDTQCGNPGADDNASGVLCVLALARALAGRRHRRTLRFYSFGTEEQLSVGATAHVRNTGLTPRQVGLLINFDSVASPLGHLQMLIAGPRELEQAAASALASAQAEVAVQREVTPFGDVFPFNRVGIPSLWFMRSNFPGGRWQHHSPHDTLENVSTDEVQRLLRAAAPLIRQWAQAERWPFPSRLPAAQRRQAEQLGRELLGW